MFISLSRKPSLGIAGGHKHRLNKTTLRVPTILAPFLYLSYSLLGWNQTSDRDDVTGPLPCRLLRMHNKRLHKSHGGSSSHTCHHLRLTVALQHTSATDISPAAPLAFLLLPSLQTPAYNSLSGCESQTAGPVWFYTWWLIRGLTLHIKGRWQLYGPPYSKRWRHRAVLLRLYNSSGAGLNHLHSESQRGRGREGRVGVKSLARVRAKVCVRARVCMRERACARRLLCVCCVRLN